MGDVFVTVLAYRKFLPNCAWRAYLGFQLMLWSEHGLLYAMVSDEEVEETLEYARLCAQQMRTPT